MAKALVSIAMPLALLAVGESPAIPQRAGQVQDEDTPRDVFREEVHVTEVLLDVLVTDGDGHVVLGLGPEDFVVEEGKKEFEVTSVTFYGDHRSLRASGSGRSDRYFLLFFHDEMSIAVTSAFRTARSRAARDAEQWVDQGLLPNDQVAVLSYTNTLQVLQDFTRDREALHAAVKGAGRGMRVRSDWRSRRTPPSDDSPSLTVSLPTGPDFRRQTRTVQQAMELVARASEGIVGRKILMLFSMGFGESQLAPASKDYRRMMQSLNSGNVAVYGLDLTSLALDGDPRRAFFGSLSKVAHDTGGRYYATGTNFLRPMREIAADNVGYYLISYRSSYEAGTTGYRHVEVRTHNKVFRVRARRGYRYGP